MPLSVVVLDAFPLTRNGKVDHGALPAPGSARPALSRAYTPPRTPFETALARVFEDVLGVEEPGIDDDFFVLGGHSLLVAQAVVRIRDELGADIPLRQLFDTPTIGLLAQALTSGGRSSHGALPPIRRQARDGEPFPLSYSQEMVWFLGQFAPEATPYNVGFAIRLRGALNVRALERALGEIVRRHEVLHSSFPDRLGVPCQVIGKPWPVRLNVYVLDDTPRDAVNDMVRQHYRAISGAFDVASEPLVRWRLLRLSADEHLLLQVEHHFIHDGWSVGRFLREFKAIYAAYSQGRQHFLAELPVQFADLVMWQRELVESGALEHQVEHWRGQLSGGRVAPLNLLGERARPASPAFRGAVHRLPLSDQHCARLTTMAAKQGATLFMAMYAIFAVTCQAFTATDDIVIGSSSANRSLRETEDLLGMVVNPLVLRLDTSGDPSFRGLLERARTVVLDAFENADVPFQLLVRRLAPGRIPR